MKILFLSPLVPYPPVDGDRQRAYHLLQALASRHTVHLLCAYQTRTEGRRLADLKGLCASVEGVHHPRRRIVANSLAAWANPEPLNVAAFRNATLLRRTRELAARLGADAVHAYRLRMAPYALAAPVRRRVLDYTDALTRYFQARLKEPAPFWKGAYLRREAARVADYEARIGRHFDACLISSPHDRDELLRRGAAPNFTVVSNGADLQALHPTARLTPEPVVLFVGNLRYPPNALGVEAFCREVWPAIHAEVPKARFLAVGRPPRRPARFPGAEFAGVVADLGPYYAQARVAVCPLEVAAGRQFKVIEAFAAGVPVVTTPVVAGNLDTKPGRHLLAAADPAGFAHHVVRLCRDHALASRLRRAARTLAVARFGWDRAARDLLAVYRGLNARAPRRDP